MGALLPSCRTRSEGPSVDRVTLRLQRLRSPSARAPCSTRRLSTAVEKEVACRTLTPALKPGLVLRLSRARKYTHTRGVVRRKQNSRHLCEVRSDDVISRSTLETFFSGAGSIGGKLRSGPRGLGQCLVVYLSQRLLERL